MNSFNTGALNAFAKVCHEIAKNNGFWEADGTPYDKRVVLALALIMTEAAEAIEEIRRLGVQVPILDRDAKNDLINHSLIDEMADIVIRLFDLSGYLEIDLDKAVAAKIEKNRRRPYKHGKRL